MQARCKQTLPTERACVAKVARRSERYALRILRAFVHFAAG